MASRLGVTLKDWWQHRSWQRKIYDIVLYGFALAGVAIIGVWLLYQTGITNNSGAVDKNYRSMLSVEEMETIKNTPMTDTAVSELWAEQYAKLIAFSRYYPANARLIMQAAQQCNDPMMVDKMISAAEIHIDEGDGYRQLSGELISRTKSVRQHNDGLVVPWMNTMEWQALRGSLEHDKLLIEEAGRLTGVEPRMIASCLVGEQIRLFNTKREQIKRYLGPLKALSVQSQFSYGVNGIKLSTAKAIESHLKDTASPFYMGPRYENLLDYTLPEGKERDDERYNRLVDYRNHLYSYLYTACILHQTMAQWKRAGYDISDRPEILFTLFNVGFSQSVPKPDPVCGGSHIKVGDRVYTFGAIGFDFYYSGELAEFFPYWRKHFIPGDEELTEEELAYIQGSVSNCKRPPRGSEYWKKDSVATPPPPDDPYAHLHDDDDNNFTPVIAM